VEVTADKAAEFGVQWQNINGINKSGSNIIGGTNFGTGNNIIGASADITTVGQGLNIGIVKGTTTLLDGTQVLNLGMLARALESDTNANILSAPNLMTLDNEEAKIVVGQNVPFITGSYTNTGSSSTAANPFQTIERKDVGLTLKIKPQIMQGGTVKLQVYQEVSSVLSSSLTSATGITTNKRSIESSVLVDENQIVVLGGLIQDSINNVQSKTPILGDIPLLGNLFRYETRQRSKTNLMVFIRPYIMYQAEASQRLANERYGQIDRTRKDAKLDDHWMLPDDDTKEMPSLKVDDALGTSSPVPATAVAEPNQP
jgi:general secretion pathway protein D